MKKFKKMAICTFAFVLALSMTACGKDKKDSADDTTAEDEYEYIEEDTEEEAAGEDETVTWGFYTVNVPAGYTFRGGDVFDENDTRYFQVKKSELTYFDFKAENSEDVMMNQYNYNKNTYTNEQTDVSGTFGDIDWTGFQYSDGWGGYGFELYATVNGKYIRVSAAGFAFDDEATKKVLGSLKIGEADGDAEDTEAVEEASETDAETTEAEEVINYIQTNEMDNATVGIPEGYTIVKETSSQIVLDNDETGGRVAFWTGNVSADEQIRRSMGEDSGFEQQEWDIGDIHWIGYIPYDNAYSVATDAGDGYFLIDMQYGTMEELEMLIKGVELAE